MAPLIILASKQNLIFMMIAKSISMKIYMTLNEYLAIYFYQFSKNYFQIYPLNLFYVRGHFFHWLPKLKWNSVHGAIERYDPKINFNFISKTPEMKNYFTLKKNPLNPKFACHLHGMFCFFRNESPTPKIQIQYLTINLGFLKNFDYARRPLPLFYSKPPKSKKFEWMLFLNFWEIFMSVTCFQ